MEDIKVTPEIGAEEGILKIRKVVGRWLSPNGIKARDAIAQVADVLLAVRLPAVEISISTGNLHADNLLRTLEAQADKALGAPPPRVFSGLTAAKSKDIVDHLQDMIDQAVHKPGEWREGMSAGGSITNNVAVFGTDEIGVLKERRDAFLAIDTVNALPKLLERIRGAEMGERSADAEVERLQGLLEAAKTLGVSACDQVIATCQEQTPALRDVAAERQRQVTIEGWTPEHDDEHDSGTLAASASAYALFAADELNPHSQGDGDYGRAPPEMWPFQRTWWKPDSERSALVKAGALILAEIERLDRAANKAAIQEGLADAEAGRLIPLADVKARFEQLSPSNKTAIAMAQAVEMRENWPANACWIKWDADACAPRPTNVAAVRFRNGSETFSVSGVNWAPQSDSFRYTEVVAYRLNPTGDSWIPWESQKDGTCPVEAGVVVDVKFRGGEVALGVPALTSQPAAAVHWDLDHLAHDIVAYRLTDPSAAVRPS